MSAFSVRIPNSLHDELRELAEKEGVSINQLALSALAEKVAVLRNSDRYNPNMVRERAAKGATSAMDGIALALPALMRAEKLQKRAARQGFDWPDATGPADKVREEMMELAEATPDKREEEAGDLLFAAVNLVRAYGIAPEDVLRRANDKFARRYKLMEALSQIDGEQFSALTLDQQEALWQKVKAGGG